MNGLLNRSRFGVGVGVVGAGVLGPGPGRSGNRSSGNDGKGESVLSKGWSQLKCDGGVGNLVPWAV